MMSSCLTFDPRDNLNFSLLPAFINGFANVQISGLYCEGKRSYTLSNDRKLIDEFQKCYHLVYSNFKKHLSLMLCTTLMSS